MTPEEKLTALLAAEAPRRPDYVFQAVVAEKIARRRFWLAMAATLPWTVAAGIVLWALAPTMAGVVDAGGALLGVVWPAAVCLAGVAFVLRQIGLLRRV